MVNIEHMGATMGLIGGFVGLIVFVLLPIGMGMIADILGELEERERDH